MKVLLIDNACKHGSTGEICYNLYNYINRAGHTAAVFYGRGEAIDEENIYKFGLDHETLMHAFLSRLTGFNGCFSPLSTRRLIRRIEAFRPDVIHLHELHAYFVDIAPLIEYIKKRGIPVVWTFHCEYMYTGKCGHAGTCERWKTGCGHCPSVRDYPKSLFFDQTARMFSEKSRLLGDLKAVYVTPSEFFAKRVRQSFLRNKRVEVINNGINTEIYYPRGKGKARSELGIPADRTIVLSVAPWIMSRAKGGGWVLELAKRQKDPRVEYMLVGDGERIEKPLENVTIVPLVRNRAKLAEIYSEADCFVLCSEHETFSLTCAEALCCGVPVAGFKCGAPETIFKHPWAEFVDYGDLDGLEKAIAVQLNRDRGGIPEYGAQTFSKEKMCSAYLKQYLESVEEI